MENSYKKLSHFRDILTMMNEQDKNVHHKDKPPYTDKQFEEDVKKWFAETKTVFNPN